jgi:hypothetical protein
MECSRATELFSEYLDDILDAKTRRVLDEHLAACGRCANDLRALQATLAALGSLDMVKAPADFLEKLHDRIRRDEQVSRFAWLKEKLFFPIRVKLPLEVAGLVMAVVLVVFIHQGTKRESGPVYGPAQNAAPAGTKSGLRAQMPSRRELEAIPAVPPQSSAVGLDAAAPSPTPAPVPGASTRSVQLVLRIGAAREASVGFVEKDDRADRAQQPAAATEGESALESKKELPPRPVLQQEARPAAPAASGAGMVPSAVTGAGGSRGQANVEEFSREPAGKPIPGKARARDAKHLRDASRTLDKQPGPTPMDPQKALAEIRGLAQNLGGVTESVKYSDITSQPESLRVRISGQSFPIFLDQLEHIGQPRDVAPALIQPTEGETLVVEITLELAQ